MAPDISKVGTDGHLNPDGLRGVLALIEDR
jgi:hypothetical protein